MKTLLPLAALAAAVLASPSDAAPAPASAPHVVHYSDLDLASAGGRRELDRRIRLTVREACGAASDADLQGKNLVLRCRVAAHAQADAQRAAALASGRRDDARLAVR